MLASHALHVSAIIYYCYIEKFQMETVIKKLTRWTKLTTAVIKIKN